MTHMLHTTATYENGVLKLPAPLPGFTNGDRVEVALVRVPTIDREQLPTPSEQGDDYDVLEAMNATRLSEGARPLIPPAGEVKCPRS